MTIQDSAFAVQLVCCAASIAAMTWTLFMVAVDRRAERRSRRVKAILDDALLSNIAAWRSKSELDRAARFQRSAELLEHAEQMLKSNRAEKP